MASTFQVVSPMLSQPVEPSAEMEADIRQRLKRVCERYSPADFDALVRRIAAIRAKYEALDANMFLRGGRALAAKQAREGSR